MDNKGMILKILLPSGIFLQKENVLRIVAETHSGSFGILPHRLDCATPLTAGILCYEAAGEEEQFVAVDEGVLLKAGAEVSVSVRNAIAGAALGTLKKKLQQDILEKTEQELNVKAVLARMEADFTRRFRELRRLH